MVIGGISDPQKAEDTSKMIWLFAQMPQIQSKTLRLFINNNVLLLFLQMAGRRKTRLISNELTLLLSES